MQSEQHPAPHAHMVALVLLSYAWRQASVEGARAEVTLTPPLSAAVADAAMVQAQGVFSAEATAEQLQQLQQGIHYDVITLTD